jgi:hypothetical protein
MAKSGATGALARAWWTVDRFGLSPAKLPARVFNRTQPRILCVSVPKSGTHLIERALCLHPRLYRKILPTVKDNNIAKWGGLDGLLGRLRSGQVTMAHLPFEPPFPDVLARRRPKTLFVIRDPRDVAVSEAHYLAGRTDHRLHELFASQPSLQDMVMLVVRGEPDHHVFSMGEKLHRYEGWLDSGALVVRFEDLVGGAGGGDDEVQRRTLAAVFDHLEVEVGPGFVDDVARKVFSPASPTFRRGAIGGWRDVFTPEISEAFDRTAGPYLARYGYAHAR